MNRLIQSQTPNEATTCWRGGKPKAQRVPLAFNNFQRRSLNISFFVALILIFALAFCFLPLIPRPNEFFFLWRLVVACRGLGSKRSDSPRTGVSSSSSTRTRPLRNCPGKKSRLGFSKRIKNLSNLRPPGGTDPTSLKRDILPSHQRPTRNGAGRFLRDLVHLLFGQAATQ